MTDTAPKLTTRGLARHKALIQAAADLFLARGYDAVSVDEIVARAGGSKTNVYRQFGGKEGLFLEVVETLSQEFLSPLRQLDPGPLPVEAGLVMLGRRLLSQQLDSRHIAFQRMIVAASDQFPQLMAHWYDLGPRQSQQILARLLKGAEDPAALASFFHDMITTDPLTRAMMGQAPDRAEVEARIDAAAALTLRALG